MRTTSNVDTSKIFLKEMFVVVSRSSDVLLSRYDADVIKNELNNINL